MVTKLSTCVIFPLGRKSEIPRDSMSVEFTCKFSHFRRRIVHIIESQHSPATADACGGTMSLRFGALDEPLITAVLNRLLAEPVSFLLTL